MRFVVGLLLGLGLGFAGALLLAPRPREGAEGLEGLEGIDERRDPLLAVRGGIEDVRRKAAEAMREARRAAREAEEEMRERYRRQVKVPRRP